MAGDKHVKYVKSYIKQVWGWSDARKEAKLRAQIAPGEWRCEKCGAAPLVKGEYEVDHVVPCESTTSPIRRWADDWNGYILRTMVPSGGLQVICKPCHHPKSAKENAARRIARKAPK